MPEGDTIHRTAARLRVALVGHPLVRVELPRRPPPLPTVGSAIERVEARGKHLLVYVADGRIVHTHQRMVGTWHLYRPGEHWRRARAGARVVLGVRDALAVCFGAPVVEVLDASALARHPVLRNLGPDLTDPTADLEAAVQRSRRLLDPRRTLGEALLDQRVACGVGNVYRCEVLFLHERHPATPLHAVDDTALRAMLRTAGDLLRRNLTDSRRSTSPGGGLWVYGRAGADCRRCGTAIVRTRLGDPARVVDHCPGCQSERAPA